MPARIPNATVEAGLPLYGLVRGQDVDAIAISHCHHDHVGSLPLAVRHFPEAHVLMTELSYFLVERVLHNSVNVMQRQREELGLREYPLYTHDEVDDLAARFQGFRYGREIEWAALQRRGWVPAHPPWSSTTPATPSARPGSWCAERRKPCSTPGDVSFGDQTLLRGARFDEVEADVLLMETTRGNRAGAGRVQPRGRSERLAAGHPAGPEAQGQRADPGLRPGADPGDPGPAGAAHAGRAGCGGSPSTLEAWVGSSPRSTISKPTAPTAGTAPCSSTKP